ncbi:MAG: DUF2219 family protein [Flavobacteriaceae bacterium]|nr:DUF2219 family protein [Flavobacteriaceae bacterium]
MNKILYFQIFLVMGFFGAKSQNYQRQLYLQVDNDLYFSRDRAYSNGIMVGYSKKLSRDFMFVKVNSQEALQFDLQVGHQIYTPGDIDALNTRFFDRPFAGWLFAEAALTKATTHRMYRVALEAGVTGDASFAEDMQVWYHRLLGIDKKPSWIDQIPGELMVNIKPQFVFDKVLRDDFLLNFVSNGSLGTKDIFIEQFAGFVYGNRNSLSTTSDFGMIGTSSTKEFFAFAQVGYRYVVQNSLLEGSLLNDNAPFTVDPEESILKFNLGVVYANQKNVFRAVFHFNTNEAPLEDNQMYVELKYAFRF